MTHTSDPQELFADGRFSEALRALDTRTAAHRLTLMDGDVLRAELLERTGKYAESEVLARRLLANKQLSVRHKRYWMRG